MKHHISILIVAGLWCHGLWHGMSEGPTCWGCIKSVCRHLEENKASWETPPSKEELWLTAETASCEDSVGDRALTNKIYFRNVFNGIYNSKCHDFTWLVGSGTLLAPPTSAFFSFQSVSECIAVVRRCDKYCVLTRTATPSKWAEILNTNIRSHTWKHAGVHLCSCLLPVY